MGDCWDGRCGLVSPAMGQGYSRKALTGFMWICVVFLPPAMGRGNRGKPYGLCSFPLAKSITPAIVAGDGNGTYCK